MNVQTPHDLDNERTVLSGLIQGLISNNELDQDYFHNISHKEIFNIITHLTSKSIPIDITTIHEEAKERKLLTEIGGNEYLTLIVREQVLGDRSAVLHILSKLKQSKDKRKLLHICHVVSDELLTDKTTYDDAVKNITNFLNSTANSNNEHEFKIPEPNKIDESAYIGLAGDIVNTIEPNSESDPAALLMSFLTAFGNVIGDKPHFKVEADKHPLRLFTVLIGKSSKGRKGTSWGYIKKLFQHIDPEWCNNIGSGLSSGEGIIWAVRDPIIKQEPIKDDKRIVGYEDKVVDPGIEDKRLLIHEGEFALPLRVLEREGNVLSAILRNAWDTGNLSTLTKNTPAKATGAHISLIGHITKEELLKYLRSTEQANGFANRFLWTFVKRSKKLPFGGANIEDQLNLLAERLKKVVDFASEVDEIGWSQETKNEWEEVYDDLSKERQGVIGAITARSEPLVSRLASIYALLDFSTLIEPKHLYAALAIWDYVEQTVLYTFKELTGNTKADKLYYGLITYGGEMTKTQIIRNIFGNHIKSQELDEILDLLESLNMIEIDTQKTQGRDKILIKRIEANCEKSEKRVAFGT